MMWNDEALSYYVAKDGFHQTIDRIGRDVHAPLYYILLSFVLKIRQGQFELRVISAVSAIITPVFVYLSTRIVLGRNVALLAALLFAVSPDNLNWSQHARPYSFQTMLVAISFWGFVHILVAIWLTWLPQFVVQFSQHLAGNNIAIRHANYMTDNHWEPLADSLGVAYLWRLQPFPLFVYLPIVAVG